MGFKDVFSELEQLASAGVVEGYAIGGAVGATFYIEPNATEDIDVFVASLPGAGDTLLTLKPIFDFLTVRGAVVRGEHLVIGGWPVQFLPATTPLVEHALHEAREETVEGQATKVFSEEHLAAIALETGRPKDKIRLLQFLESASLDRKRVDGLVSTFGLTEKWARFSAQFLGDQS